MKPNHFLLFSQNYCNNRRRANEILKNETEMFAKFYSSIEKQMKQDQALKFEADVLSASPSFHLSTGQDRASVASSRQSFRHKDKNVSEISLNHSPIAGWFSNSHFPHTAIGYGNDLQLVLFTHIRAWSLVLCLSPHLGLTAAENSFLKEQRIWASEQWHETNSFCSTISHLCVVRRRGIILIYLFSST